MEPWASAAQELGLASLTVKRDDQTGPLHGGTKVRKLDFLLAEEPWASAPVWASLGAMGSGHLVALSAAAQALGRRVHAHMFWEPVEGQVLQNLAAVASGPTDIVYHGTRVGMALHSPGLLLGGRSCGRVVIRAGATCGRGTVGTVRAGLELARQVQEGLCPAPEVLVLPYGSGGTAAGVALGLALAGLPVRVLAVAAVERWFATGRRLRGEMQAALEELRPLGLPAALELPRFEVVYGFLGRAYGHATPASREACRWAAHLPVEPIYSGKALAALRSLAPELAGRHVLYWQTARRPELAAAPDWQSRLPTALRQRLAGHRPGRRRLLVGLGAAAALGGIRVSGYSTGDGRVLKGWELELVAAAARVIVPPGPPSAVEVAANVDRYLVGMPPSLHLEVHGLMARLEQVGLRRLTRLEDPTERLLRLKRLPLGSLAWRGIRDLSLLGYWQDPRTWSRCGYDGPRLPSSPRDYSELVAPAGARP